jgi:diaminopimelate epimerase
MRENSHSQSTDACFLDGVHFNAAGNSVVCFRPNPGSRDTSDLFDRIQLAIINISGYRPDIFAVIDDREIPWYVSFWNADGTPEIVCLNALRCMLPLAGLLSTKLSTINSLDVRTAHSNFRAFLQGHGMAGVFVPYSAVRVIRHSSLDYFVDVGTPHMVRIVADLLSPHIQRLGIELSRSTHPVNATFLQFHKQELHVRTFERGVGETGSCGSGALACYVIAEHSDFSHSVSHKETTIRFRSGETLFVGTDERKERYFVLGNVSSPTSFRLVLPK